VNCLRTSQIFAKRNTSTTPCGGKFVGSELVRDGLWDVKFGPIKLGRVDERRLKIEDHNGRWVRKDV